MLRLPTSHHQAVYKKADRYVQITWNEVLDQQSKYSNKSYYIKFDCVFAILRITKC